MSAPTTAQDAAIEALKSGEQYVNGMVMEYDRRRRLLVDGLNRLDCKTFEPRGAFYTFPSITASGMNDEEFAQKLLEEEHVAVVPGIHLVPEVRDLSEPVMPLPRTNRSGLAPFGKVHEQVRIKSSIVKIKTASS